MEFSNLISQSSKSYQENIETEYVLIVGDLKQIEGEVHELKWHKAMFTVNGAEVKNIS